jgi:hypothetical protein
VYKDNLFRVKDQIFQKDNYIFTLKRNIKITLIKRKGKP